MELVKKYKGNIDYFTQYGTRLEKAIVEAILSLAEGK